MANSWYVSLPLWTALPQWQASAVYALGQIVRPLSAFQYDNKCAYVVTTAGNSGSSEPGWNTNNNGTTSDNGVIWTNVTGQSSYGWSAPAGSFSTINANNDIQGRANQSDTIFIDSNSAETSVPNYNFNKSAYLPTPLKVYSVNASGAVPPTSTDYLPGASFDMGNQGISAETGYCYYGLSIINFSTFYLGNYVFSGFLYFKDCVLSQGSQQNICIQIQSAGHFILDNTQIIPYSGNTTNNIIYIDQASTFEWWNTANPTNGSYSASYPIYSNNPSWVHLKGMDLSFFTTTNCPNGMLGVGNTNSTKWTLENCYLGMPPEQLSSPPNTAFDASNEQQTIELVNCYNGSENYNNSRFNCVGYLLTKTDTLLIGGATDGLTSFSHLITSSNYAGGKDTFQTIDGFPIYFNNIIVGSSQTATIQILSDRQLTTDDIRLDIDYMSSSSYPQSRTSSSTSSPLQNPTNFAITSSTWTTVSQPTYISLAATAYQGNTLWTRTSDTLASFSGNGNPCTVFVNNSLPFSPCYMEFQNQTFSGNAIAIGVIRSDYNNSNDPRSQNYGACMFLEENGNIIVNENYISSGSNVSVPLVSMTAGSLIRMIWDGRGNVAFAINNGLWNGVYNDSQVLSGLLVPSQINYMPISTNVPFIEVKNGGASSWKIAADSGNCVYSPPSGSTYVPVAANTFVPQSLSVSFTAQNAGLTRALVRVTNPSVRVWCDPSVSLS
jgi:hypothetical protein